LLTFAAAAVPIGVQQAPSLAAGALLHPFRKPLLRAAPPGCTEAQWASAGIVLEGWRCAADGRPKATLIHLHGIADNRGSAAAIVRRYQAQGFDVIAYDSRANGASGGEACTYGFYEKHDVSRVIDSVRTGPVVLLGGSLGAAVALQAAAVDSRIRAVVAAETFSDLRTIARERAPAVLTEEMIARAFEEAESRGRFRVDEVSPVEAARHITVPVFLVHGADDRATVPDHSRRVFAALAGPKRLRIVEGAGHSGSLTADVLLGPTEDFLKGAYSRAHTWTFDGGVTVPASASPAVVRAPWSDPAAVDPEEALVASISSCHLLTFLWVASKAGFTVQSYEDQAVGVMTKNEQGRYWVSSVVLRPRIVYAGTPPSPERAADLHHRAHEDCFIANSVKTEIRVEH
jgi:organic hydroperoxide reductase OsmC/OhrA/pimeloyl-ACP methyl ester carboxylesterase